jgi:hypothetical protein
VWCGGGVVFLPIIRPPLQKLFLIVLGCGNFTIKFNIISYLVPKYGACADLDFPLSDIDQLAGKLYQLQLATATAAIHPPAAG